MLALWRSITDAYGLNFVGTNHATGSGNESALNGISAFSIICWVYCTNLTANNRIFHKGSASNNKIMLQINSTGDLQASIDTGSAAVNITKTGAGLTVKTLYHLALTYDYGSGATDADRCKLYINGVVQTSLTFSAALPSTTPSAAAPIVLGYNAVGVNSYVIGNLNNVAVYNIALDATTIDAIYDAGRFSQPPTANRIHYYPLNKGTGTTIIDYGSAGNNLSFGSGVAAPQWILLKGNNKCLNLNGIDATMSRASVSTFSSLSKISIAVWCKAFRDSSSQCVVGWRNSGGTQGLQFVIRKNSTNLQQTLRIMSGSAATGGTYSFTHDYNWHLYIMEFDGTQTGDANRLKLFIDNVQQTLTFDLAGVPANLTATTHGLFIGDLYSGAGNFFGGLIGSCAIRHEVWSSGDKTTIFSGGIKGTPPSYDSWWKFDGNGTDSGANALDLTLNAGTYYGEF